MWVLFPVGHHLFDQRYIIRHEVLVLHRMEGKIYAGHRADFARPQTTCVDYVLGVNCAFVSHYIPSAVRPLIGFTDHAMGFNCCAAHSGSLGVGMGCA